MKSDYIIDQEFKEHNFSKNFLKKGEYDHCAFVNCIFSIGDLSGINFTECRFIHCDLSMVKLRGTSFKEVNFINCKMLGLRFDVCDGFLMSMDFEKCVLNFSSFFKLNLKNTGFRDCKLEEVEFVEADLSGSRFSNCDLNRANFGGTNLEKSDFRSSYNFSIDPEENRMKKARFSLQQVPGLLEKHKLIIE